MGGQLIDTTTRADGVDEVGREATGEVPTIGVEEKLFNYGVKAKNIEGSSPRTKTPYVQQLRRSTRSRVLSQGKRNAQVASYQHIAMRPI